MKCLYLFCLTVGCLGGPAAAQMASPNLTATMARDALLFGKAEHGPAPLVSAAHPTTAASEKMESLAPTADLSRNGNHTCGHTPLPVSVGSCEVSQNALPQPIDEAAGTAGPTLSR
ncbi:hypothetical protein JANAI62_13220 [Jannaschia pagri]|uniref:Uncharacterized protein n=1 Tax=Jannaschia pagri TaxID=2829797 RepID=A0ABQ4NJX5_9RHOB|nr:hypothetical protein JANAI61_13260 [Jannaschia sp. AI_61]GIT94699.1 hypothetical protein JANAI62_13220 [Jannaschia sp. AI_62]